MAFITILVLFVSSQNLVMSVLVRRVHVAFSTAGLRAEERHVKPPRCGEASRKPRALSRVRTQAIGALAQGFYLLSYSSAPAWFIVLVCAILATAPSLQPLSPDLNKNSGMQREATRK